MCNDCLVLHERLQEQSHQLFVLKRTLSNTQKELKGERRKLEHLRKQLKPPNHYKNGQKRGKFGRNG